MPSLTDRLYGAALGASSSHALANERALVAERQERERAEAAYSQQNDQARAALEGILTEVANGGNVAGAINQHAGAIVGHPDFGQIMDLVERAVAQSQGPQPQFHMQSPGQIPSVFDPATGEFRQIGPAAPFAPPNPSVVIEQHGEKELSIQRARADAERIYTQIPTARRELRGQVQNSAAMAQLLEQGVEPGKMPDAIKTFIRDRFGVDVGLDPSLETFSTLAGQQMLADAQSLKGSFSDRDLSIVRSLTASANRGREANLAILRARQEILNRLDRELELEEQYFAKNESRAGFEEWLRAQDLGPVFSQEAVQSITKPIQEAEQAMGGRFNALADAVAKGSAKAVDEVIGRMSDAELRRLPAELRDEALRMLEGS